MSRESPLWHDLTRPLAPGGPVYPGDPAVRFRAHAELARDGYRVTEVSLGTHAGTHLDAPAHFLAGGAPVDQLPLDRLLGPARVLDLRAAETWEVAAGDRLLLRSGWEERWGGADYFHAFPPLPEALARALARAPAALLGRDTPSLHPDPEADARLHRLLLGAGVLILENLAGLAALPDHVWLAALPLPLAGLDGAPCRVVARADRTGSTADPSQE
jgi:arylformamidase